MQADAESEGEPNSGHCTPSVASDGELQVAQGSPVQIPTHHPECMLRPWRESDRADLIRNANNRSVWRNLTHMFPHPYTEADAQQWLRIANGEGRSVHLAIEFKGAAVGGIGAIAGEGISAATADFGYWLGEPFWGQGIATAAASALVGRLMGESRFSRLQASVFAWNPASMRVLEKVGFVREGVLRSSVTKDGALIDSVMYAYTAAEPGGRAAHPRPAPARGGPPRVPGAARDARRKAD